MHFWSVSFNFRLQTKTLPMTVRAKQVKATAVANISKIQTELSLSTRQTYKLARGVRKATCSREVILL